jgi:hypothetical protein
MLGKANQDILNVEKSCLKDRKGLSDKLLKQNIAQADL